MATSELRPSSTCKCVKSKCLKLYCECFRQGIPCNDDCVCIDCQNTKDNAGGKDGGSGGANNMQVEEAAATTTTTQPISCQWVDDVGAAAASDVNPTAKRPYPDKRSDRTLDPLRLLKGDGCACRNSQ